MLHTKDLQSNVIDFLRFPLIVGVLFIHNSTQTVATATAEFGNADYLPIHYVCSELFSQILGRVAVPLFFFISGFLFFLNLESFNKKCYKEKLCRRVKTLLIPYLFWNIATIAFFYSALKIPSLSIWFSKSYEFDMQHILKSFWAYPIAYQFWFIRDLMVIVVLTPLIYLYTKNVKIYGIIALGILWFTGCWFKFIDGHGLSIASLFFFSAGAWFSINRKNLIMGTDKVKYLSFALYPVLAVIDLLTKKYSYNIYVHHAGIIVGIAFWFNAAAYLLKTEKVKVNRFLAASSFFVFAIHDNWLLSPVRKILFAVLKPESDVALTALYFLIVAIVATIALILYYFLRKFVPKFTKVITGGR